MHAAGRKQGLRNKYTVASMGFQRVGMGLKHDGPVYLRLHRVPYGKYLRNEPTYLL